MVGRARNEAGPHGGPAEGSWAFGVKEPEVPDLLEDLFFADRFYDIPVAPGIEGFQMTSASFMAVVMITLTPLSGRWHAAPRGPDGLEHGDAFTSGIMMSRNIRS
jgi:hypothetical protein